MRAIQRITWWLIATLLLVLICAFAISGTVLSQSREVAKEQKEYYKMLEHEYVKEIQTFLKDQGYAASGVTMNRIIDENGSIEYRVTIHHRRILDLDMEQREKLLTKCRDVKFPVEGCSVFYELLES
ncbi:MAG: hypothetical protein Q4D94_13425 [Bacillota bacterium]|nr:hypothetical protein [Bacillota bacterium]